MCIPYKYIYINIYYIYGEIYIQYIYIACREIAMRIVKHLSHSLLFIPNLEIFQMGDYLNNLVYIPIFRK